MGRHTSMIMKSTEAFYLLNYLSEINFDWRIVFFYTLLNDKNNQFIVNKQYCTKKNTSWWVKLMTMQQLKNVNKTDKHNHTQKKRYLEVISRSTRFKEFNREKKQQQKHWISFKSFRESRHAMLVLALQNFARVVSLSLLKKPHFRYLRSSSWVELRLTQIFSMVPSNSR